MGNSSTPPAAPARGCSETPTAVRLKHEQLMIERLLRARQSSALAAPPYTSLSRSSVASLPGDGGDVEERFGLEPVQGSSSAGQ